MTCFNKYIKFYERFAQVFFRINLYPPRAKDQELRKKWAGIKNEGIVTMSAPAYRESRCPESLRSYEAFVKLLVAVSRGPRKAPQGRGYGQ